MMKSFDHLLRETLKAPAPEPPDGCLDAGVLAAWFEGTLDPGERAAAEAHAAECSRCQAVLAAIIRIEPPIESRPWWRSPAFGWLVPITVAAAALVIFIRPYWSRMDSDVALQHAPAVMARPAEPSAATQATAPPRTAPQATETTAVDSVAPKATPGPPSTQAMARERTRQEALAKRAAQAPTDAPASPTALLPSGDTAPLKDRVGSAVDESALQRPSSAAAAAPPAPAPPDARERRSAVAVGPSPEAAPVPARPAEERSTGATAMAEKGIAETVMMNARTARADDQRQIVIQAPGGSRRWRITTPGSVQRSSDAGATWETQTTGVGAVITNGIAPSDSVCWLVGKGGIVLQSADGRSWRQVPFPQAVDLVSVSAMDANTATVTTASGRTFTTRDGGRNWR